MRLITLFFLAAATLLFPCAAGAADGGRALHVEALLVLAGNQPGETDARLAPYEPTLRRILRFDTYRLAGSGSTTVAATGPSELGLGRSHSLHLAQESGGRGPRLAVRWQEGGRTLMNTGLNLRPGVPAVLGGPSTGEKGQVWAIILIAR